MPFPTKVAEKAAMTESCHVGGTSSTLGEASEPLVRVVESDGTLSNLSFDVFRFGGRTAGIVLAFVSPHVDFARVSSGLRRLAGDAPLLAISTAGELCSQADGALYKPTGTAWLSVVVQVFSPDLIAEASIHAISLHNQDIRQGGAACGRDERVVRICQSLASISLPFLLNAQDSLALTFVDGLSNCENVFMEAVYRSAKFPCLFVGGSAGGKTDFKNTYIYDGRQVVENHAVVAFLKLAPGKRYGAFKSQNFRKTDKSFVVLKADPDQRTIDTVVLQPEFSILSAVAAMCHVLDCRPEDLETRLGNHTFGIELNGELFVRSVARIELDKGRVSFFCDVHTGDRLHLLEATDFVDQTRLDMEIFLRNKPQPVAAILNDCILRRLVNQDNTKNMKWVWECPVAGFSTFGELFGINVNQTLSAIFFFDVKHGDHFEDCFMETFPIHYAFFQNYFTSRRLARVELLNDLRSRNAGQLTDLFAEMAETSEEIQSIVIHARSERELRESRKQLLAITAGLFEGVLLVDGSGTIVFANKAAERMLEANGLIGRGLDVVMMLVVDDNDVSFAAGPFHHVLETGESIIEDDAFFRLLPAGRYLNVAFTVSRLDEDGHGHAAVISFRGIGALKQAQREALLSSRLASVGQLAAGIAHEINTPIQYVGDNLVFLKTSFDQIGKAVRGVAEMVAQGRMAPDVGVAIEELFRANKVDYLLEELPVATNESLDGVAHVAHIVRSMKEFSHPGTSIKTATDLNRAIDTAVTISRNEWKLAAQIEIDLDPALPPVVCFPADINQVLLNLIVNAADAIKSLGRTELGRIVISSRQDGDMVEIKVADSGSGVPSAIRDRIYDPFFTTKSVGKGTGQGLSICLDVISNRHGGTLFLEDTHGGGATFVMRLPVDGQPRGAE